MLRVGLGRTWGRECGGTPAKRCNESVSLPPWNPGDHLKAVFFAIWWDKWPAQV